MAELISQNSPDAGSRLKKQNFPLFNLTHQIDRVSLLGVPLMVQGSLVHVGCLGNGIFLPADPVGIEDYFLDILGQNHVGSGKPPNYPGNNGKLNFLVSWINSDCAGKNVTGGQDLAAGKKTSSKATNNSKSDFLVIAVSFY